MHRYSEPLISSLCFLPQPLSHPNLPYLLAPTLCTDRRSARFSTTLNRRSTLPDTKVRDTTRPSRAPLPPPSSVFFPLTPSPLLPPPPAPPAVDAPMEMPRALPRSPEPPTSCFLCFICRDGVCLSGFARLSPLSTTPPPGVFVLGWTSMGCHLLACLCSCR
jgi:hypothetical protein